MTKPVLPDRFELRGDPLARGIAVVYRAHDRERDCEVVVKCATEGAGPLVYERLRSEAELAGELDHPGIVRILDRGEGWFSMALVDGVRLDTAAAKLPRPERIALIHAVVEAVGVMHSGGVIHRDLKPGNILVRADGTPVVLDFGLAQREEEIAGVRSSAGTARYMSPQQLSADILDPRTDVWALGVILYELLTDTRPFASPMDSGLFSQILDQDPTPPSEHDPSLPDELETIVLCALNKEPARRYPDAVAFATEIGRYRLGGLSQTTQKLRRRPWRGDPRFAIAVPVALIALCVAIWFWAFQG